jgi:hypothetical protein
MNYAAIPKYFLSHLSRLSPKSIIPGILKTNRALKSRHLFYRYFLVRSVIIFFVLTFIKVQQPFWV